MKTTLRKMVLGLMFIISGKIIAMVGDNMSWVDEKGWVHEQTFLMLGGALIIIVGLGIMVGTLIVALARKIFGDWNSQ